MTGIAKQFFTLFLCSLWATLNFIAGFFITYEKPYALLIVFPLATGVCIFHSLFTLIGEWADSK